MVCRSIRRTKSEKETTHYSREGRLGGKLARAEVSAGDKTKRAEIPQGSTRTQKERLAARRKGPRMRGKKRGGDQNARWSLGPKGEKNVQGEKGLADISSSGAGLCREVFRESLISSLNSLRRTVLAWPRFSSRRLGDLQCLRTKLHTRRLHWDSPFACLIGGASSSRKLSEHSGRSGALSTKNWKGTFEEIKSKNRPTAPA